MPYKDRKDLYAAQKRHRIRMRKRVLDYLLEKECIDCGEGDPIVLDFDHIDRETKFKNVGRMLSGHYGWDKLLAEIQKCEIRCANCHRKKTYIQLGHWGKNIPR